MTVKAAQGSDVKHLNHVQNKYGWTTDECGTPKKINFVPEE